MIHLSIIYGGRAIPLLWSVKEHSSATIGFEVYQPLLRKASWLLRRQDDVMLLADRGAECTSPHADDLKSSEWRGFANQALLKWLKQRDWLILVYVTLRNSIAFIW